MITVLILAAGYGKRMGPFARMVNKSLIPYDNKPLISHIIDKFDQDTKFVIACGHRGQQVKDYVSAVHTQRQIVYVDIPDFSEVHTGPATTIQHCAKYIQGPFMWLACDTLFDFDYKDKLDHNWIGVHPVDSAISQDYCWVERDGEVITKIVNKQPSNSAVDAFIGLMFCQDTTFIDNLKQANAKEAYEGMLDNLNLQAHTVRRWYDVGTYEKWVELSKDLDEVSFPKPNELFYHDNDKIVKFTVDSTLTDLKANRALMNLECMPTGIKRAGQFLIYDYVEGDIVYDCLTPDVFNRLLTWADTQLWKSKWFPNTSTICREFYYKKTQDRMNQFRVKYANWSEPCVINGYKVRTMDQYVNMIDWDWLCKTAEWRFIHGDFQFENIIYNSNSQTFTCIDWRTDFGGDSYGDLYYDLAKMLGGILLNYQKVKAGQLEYHEDGDTVELNYCGIEDDSAYISLLDRWVRAKGYNWDKVQQLVPLIYLNMSPLHEAPFDKYLFCLAQLQFSRFFDAAE